MAKISKDNQDLKRAKHLNHMSVKLREQDPIESEKLAREAVSLAKLSGDQLEAATGIHNIGASFMVRSEYEKALEYFNQALALKKQKKDEKGVNEIINNMAIVYFKQGNFKLALEAFAEVAQYWEKTDSLSQLSAAYNNIGALYSCRGDEKQALKYFFKATELLERTGGDIHLANSYNNIGLAQMRLKNNEAAVKYFRKSLKLMKRENNPNGTAMVYLNLGVIYLNEEKLDKALEFFEQALKLKRSIGDKLGIAKALVNIGSVLTKKERFDPAKEILEEAIQIADKINAQSEKALALENLFRLYKAREDYKRALEYFQAKQTVMEKLFDAVREKQLVDAKIKFETQLKEREMKLYKERSAEQRRINSELKSVIEKHKKIEEELSRSEAKFRAVTTSVTDAVIIIDSESRISFLNQAAEKIFGFAPREIMGKNIHDMLAPEEYLEPAKNGWKRFKHSGEGNVIGKIVEVKAKTKSGRIIPIELSVSPVPLESGLIVIGIARDISERKEAEKRLKQSLLEKQILLKEIHHRVKNNLSIVSSLLGLHAESIPDEEIAQKFVDCQAQVQSIALIHQQFYQTENVAEIDFRDYLDTVFTHLKTIYQSQFESIKITLRIDPIRFSLNKSIPLGLIVNELITNVFKHAYSAGDCAEIEVELHEVENGEAELIVRDYGKGLPEGTNADSTSSLGLQLITVFVDQIDGKLKIDSENGTRFAIQFTP